MTDEEEGEGVLVAIVDVKDNWPPSEALDVAISMLVVCVAEVFVEVITAVQLFPLSGTMAEAEVCR